MIALTVKILFWKNIFAKIQNVFVVLKIHLLKNLNVVMVKKVFFTICIKFLEIILLTK